MQCQFVYYKRTEYGNNWYSSCNVGSFTINVQNKKFSSNIKSYNNIQQQLKNILGYFSKLGKYNKSILKFIPFSSKNLLTKINFSLLVK